jgi:hypothetical protein
MGWEGDYGWWAGKDLVLRETAKSSVSTASGMAAIKSVHLPNASPEYYCYTYLLSKTGCSSLQLCNVCSSLSTKTTSKIWCCANVSLQRTINVENFKNSLVLSEQYKSNLKARIYSNRLQKLSLFSALCYIFHFNRKKKAWFRRISWRSIRTVHTTIKRNVSILCVP